MDELGTAVNVITAVALISGLFFAAYEFRRSRIESRRQSEMLALRSFDTPEFAKAMRKILQLPEGLSVAQVEGAMGEDGVDLLWYYLGVMEALGIFVCNRDIDIRLVDRMVGGPVILSWHKLRQYSDEVRAKLGRDSMYEWFQWLAERLESLEQAEGRTAAYVREKDWQP